VGHLIAGERSVEEVLLNHEGLTILPNGCGQSALTRLDRAQRASLLETVRHGCPERDLVVADTHPGISTFTVELLREAQVTMVLSTPEPTALTDTYALFKVLDEQAMRGPVGLVINQASSREEADDAARHLDAVARRFLGHGIDYWGFVSQDAAVPRAVRQQRALLSAAPRSGAARLLREIARIVSGLVERDMVVTGARVNAGLCRR
jgi:flagellar biosynthesis protein FlhG